MGRKNVVNLLLREARVNKARRKVKKTFIFLLSLLLMGMGLVSDKIYGGVKNANSSFLATQIS